MKTSMTVFFALDRKIGQLKKLCLHLIKDSVKRQHLNDDYK